MAIVIGQKISTILYGYRTGYITAIHGTQRPETVRSLYGGVGVMGGNASFDIVFTNGGRVIMLPEAILLGVQWEVYDEVTTPEHIAELLANAEVVKAEGERAAAEAARRREAERAQHLADNPHLTPKSAKPDYSPGKLAAANIRKELKAGFPGVKFRVRSDFNSVNITVPKDGPEIKAVEALTSKYQSGRFNGMEDIYEYSADATFAAVFGGPRYVFVQRAY